MITNKKSNWGKYLMLGMGCFMLFIVVLVVMMFKQPADEYDPRYYERGLNYNSEYARERNVLIDIVEPIIKIEQGKCSINFKGNVTGKIVFARPSDKKMDREFVMDNSKHFITPTGFVNGNWQLTLTWKQHGKEYLYKKDIYIP
ncbi:MAG: nitrogen fixation protein FixH [Sphingobacteriales bacterium]|nr:MAG: nitrogen fixation protein FixH [Sphingobacteriales bacterium]